ncbi:tetratricopeptide repeat protein [Candidatus Poribacteria bacterium]|nr:tetratricopeptide repeat protein [Candidatus Poribacteria bacterium]
MRLQLPTIIVLCLSLIVIVSLIYVQKNDQAMSRDSRKTESEIFNSLREQAQIAFHEKKYAEAIRVYDEALIIRPENAEIYTAIGAAYYELGLEQAGPNWPSWESDLANRTPAAALHELQTAIAQAGSGYIVLKADRPEVIQAIQKKAQEVGAYLYTAQLRHGATINIVIGQTNELFTKARSAYFRAIDLKPTYGPAYRNLGSLYMKIGQHDAAVDYLQKAHQLDPRDTELEEYLNQLK